MKIALISDIHGNYIALKEVLNDIQKNNIGKIICLGDIATLGADPVKVVETMQSIDCHFIMGNHDEFIFKPELIKDYIKVPEAAEAIEWTISKLSETQIDFFRNLKRRIIINISDTAKMLFYHGSPGSNTDNILPTTPDDEIEKMFSDSTTNFVLMGGGHTHIQMYRKYKGGIMINPGSVGFPFKEFVAGKVPVVLPQAEYAIIEIENDNIHVTLKQIKLNKKDLLDNAMASEEPIRKMLVEQYK